MQASSSSGRSPFVAHFDRGHPCFRNFNSTTPVDNIKVKSYVGSFLDPACVQVRISINKLDLVPDWIVAGLVGVFRNGKSLGTGESYIPAVFFDPLRHGSPCFPNVDFATIAGNPVDSAIMVALSVTEVSSQIGRRCECLVVLGSCGEAPIVLGQVKRPWI